MMILLSSFLARLQDWFVQQIGIPLLEGAALLLVLGFIADAMGWPKKKDPAPAIQRGRRLISAAEAERIAAKIRTSNDPGIRWGSLLLPSEAAARHFIAVGTTGSGKTLLLRMLTQSVLPTITPGSNRRALLYDVKHDQLGLLSGMGVSCPLILTNPFDERSLAWDIAKDVTAPATAFEIATILVPPDKNASQPFFSDAARHVLAGVMVAFIRTVPGRWTFADVVYTLQSKARIETVLTRTPETTEIYAQYFAQAERGADILATISTRMAPFSFLAACWSRASGTFSLRDWLAGEAILILGADEANRAALDAINRVLFKRACELILSEADSESRQTWIFLDEVRMAGQLDGLHSVLIMGRSKGCRVALGLQDVEGLKAVYGPQVAGEILGQCGNVAILRLASSTTARWASDLFGSFETLEQRTSESSGTSEHGGESSGSTKSEQMVTRDAVLPSQFLSIPPTKPENGLTGFYIVPGIGAFRSTLSGEWLQRELRDPDPTVPGLILRPEAQQYLPAWTADDRERLGLKQMPTPMPSGSRARPARPSPSHPLGGLKGFAQAPADAPTTSTDADSATGADPIGEDHAD